MSELILSEAEAARVRGALARNPWYRRAFESFGQRVDELIRRAPVIPVAKSRVFFESCATCATRLIFDPYLPHRHVCPSCGRDHSDPVYDLAWLRQFHEWLAKRLVEAGILYALEHEERYARLVRDTLLHYAEHYQDYPLANNLLGPTRLFQSTYLEAFWLVDLVVAYDLARSCSVFSDADHRAVKGLLYASSSVVRSYDEGTSNRQAFNNAALGAVGLLYDDAELVDHALAGPHGFAFHMRTSVLEDGIWYEGENYHFATLDHTLNLAEMALHRGIDLYHGGAGLGSLMPMFDGPLKVMLPDLTFPSRKDSWFGRGMAFHRPAYELGFARYHDERYGRLLAHSYATGVERGDLDWRTFLYLESTLPLLDAVGPTGERDRSPAVAMPPFTALDAQGLRPTGSERMPGTGVAVLRDDNGDCYASVEYGHYGGGHGHPDRLHLTLFAGGVHWLLDPGTGWYHVPELGWYRSTLAHNTITIDGSLQRPQEGRLVTFGGAGGFRACQAVVEDVAPGLSARRTLLLGPGFLLDVLDTLPGPDERERQIDWTFHTPGRFDLDVTQLPLASAGERDGYEFLQNVRSARLDQPLDLLARYGGAQLRVTQRSFALAPADGAEPPIAYLAEAPGVPGHEGWPLSSVIVRRRAQGPVRFVTAWLWGKEGTAARFACPSVEQATLTLAGRRFEVHVPPFTALTEGGVAIVSRVRAADAAPDALAWFGLRSWNVGDVHVEADRPLAHGALTRTDGGPAWRAELPDGFGRVTVRGLTEGRQVFEQAPGRSMWHAADRPQMLFPGAVTAVSFDLGSYGVLPLPPALEVPDGWHIDTLERTERTGSVESWTAHVRVPAAAPDAVPALGVRVGDDLFHLPCQVAAPLAVRWHLRSVDGAPTLLLEVRDLQGIGGELRHCFDVPWAEASTRGGVHLPAHGVVHVALALPRGEPPHALAGCPAADLGIDARVEDPTSDTNTLTGWPLPGLTGNAGAWHAAAHLERNGFTGTTRARFPLLWADAAGGVIRLDRAEQALWADRPWGGPVDSSAEAKVSVGSNGVRLVCRVWDDVHVADPGAQDLYENDSVQVYFDFRAVHHENRNFTQGVAAYVLAPDATKGRLAVWPIAGNREISNRAARAAWFTVEGVVGSCRAFDDGYEIDAFLPYAAMGVDRPERGDVLGFDLAVSDNDGTWYRNTQLLWSGNRGRRCYIRGSYHDPCEFGWLLVGGEA